MCLSYPINQIRNMKRSSIHRFETLTKGESPWKGIGPFGIASLPPFRLLFLFFNRVNRVHCDTWQQKTLLSSSLTRLRNIRERADMGAQTPETSESLQKEIQKNQKEIQ